MGIFHGKATEFFLSPFCFGYNSTASDSADLQCIKRRVLDTLSSLRRAQNTSEVSTAQSRHYDDRQSMECAACFPASFFDAFQLHRQLERVFAPKLEQLRSRIHTDDPVLDSSEERAVILGR